VRDVGQWGGMGWEMECDIVMAGMCVPLVIRCVAACSGIATWTILGSAHIMLILNPSRVRDTQEATILSSLPLISHPGGRFRSREYPHAFHSTSLAEQRSDISSGVHGRVAKDMLALRLGLYPTSVTRSSVIDASM
jgi:hypothetical protein